MDFSQIDEGHPDGEETMIFRYNREERIKRAPQIVQDYYAGKMTPKKGLFRALVQTRPTRILFITICMLCVFGIILGFVQKDSAAKIGGQNFSINAFSYEEDVYASVKINDNKKKDYNIPVTVKFTAIEKSGSPCDSAEVSDVYKGDELFIRAKFRDYDVAKVSAEITVGEESKSISAAVEKR